MGARKRSVAAAPMTFSQNSASATSLRQLSLAGLWNTWIDKATGEVHESYTMLTINADDHPLMRRMHKPDLKAQRDKQGKRSVIPLEAADFDQWLEGTVEQARGLMKLAPVEVFVAGPLAPSQRELG